MNSSTNERFSTLEIDLGTGPVGCFCIHGFCGSTYELQGMAEFLAEHGFRVKAPLLAGHGTSIEECNLVHADDWLQEIEYHFAEFFLYCTSAFVIGLGMGATLALHLSALFPVSGVVAMAPTFILNRFKLPWYLQILAPFHNSIAIRSSRADQDNSPNPNDYGYSRYPTNGIRAMFKLNRYVRKELPRVMAPALIMHSRDDPIAPFENALLVANSINSEDKSLITYDKFGHVLPDCPEKKTVWTDILNFLTRDTPS